LTKTQLQCTKRKGKCIGYNSSINQSVFHSFTQRLQRTCFFHHWQTGYTVP